MVRDEIITIIKKALLRQGSAGQAVHDDAPVDITVPEAAAFGHFSTNIAMRLAKARGVKPMELAEELAANMITGAPAGFFEKVEAAAPGFVNFWLSKETIQKEFTAIAVDENFGTNERMKGKTVMVEYTDANPFKLFHIGHLMSNTIGESFARLYEATSATVRRANYYGDLGVHIASAVWGMEELRSETPKETDDALTKTTFLGRAYALGATAYKENQEAKAAIDAINVKLYAKSDTHLNELYETGKSWSLAYFETIYERLGTKFDDYFPESFVSEEGKALVQAHEDIFKKSEGAIIFAGEEYGLHTRVFINSQGLPTYEAKELGLNKKKFELHPLSLSIIITGNEINDYFKVLMKAIELTLPEVAAKTRHISHGMMRLSTGKMSSRTGNVITAEALIDQAKQKIEEKMRDNAEIEGAERVQIAEAIAIGALKYSILKQAPGQDIMFDFEKSLSFEGDAGPYIQYTYARLQSILRKANYEPKATNDKTDSLDSESELELMRKVAEFPEIVRRAQDALASNGIATYLYQFASLINKFYETTPILKDENEERRNARLMLIETSARTLKSGLNLLGIEAPEKI